MRCKEKILHNEGGRCWHRLPREAVDAPSLEVLKARLDGPCVQSEQPDLVGAVSAHGRGSEGLFQPIPFCDSTILRADRCSPRANS